MPMIQLDPSILENLYPPLLAFQLPMLNKDFLNASVVDVNEQCGILICIVKYVNGWKIYTTQWACVFEMTHTRCYKNIYESGVHWNNKIGKWT